MWEKGNSSLSIIFQPVSTLIYEIRKILRKCKLVNVVEGNGVVQLIRFSIFFKL